MVTALQGTSQTYYAAVNGSTGQPLYPVVGQWWTLSSQQAADIAEGNASIIGGSVWFTAGDYGANGVGVSLSVKNNTYVVIDQGVTGLTYSAAANANATVEDRTNNVYLQYVLGSATYPRGNAWLDGWTYRQSHIVGNLTGAGIDYQIPITVTYDTSSFYALSSQSSTIVGNPSNRHTFEPAHNSTIAQVNMLIDGGIQKYVAYDCTSAHQRNKLYYTTTQLGNGPPTVETPF
jgi:hypothetical protein